MINLSKRPVYRFWRNCTQFEYPEIRPLQAMIDNAITITWKTFRQHVALADLEQLFPDYKWNQGPCRKDDWGLHLRDDWHVSFHRSKYRMKTVYYLRHSSIEYIFAEGGQS